MHREFGTVFPENANQGLRPGDAAAQAVALGLAERCDADTLIAFGDAISLLERVGGQFHVVALRRPVDDSEEYETYGIAFRYETRDSRLKVAKAPDQILGLPISDCQVPESALPEVELKPQDGREGQPATETDEAPLAA